MQRCGWLGKFCFAVFLAAWGAGLVVPTPGATQDKPTPGGELIWVLTQEPDTIDPHITTLASAANINLRIFDNLVNIGPDQNFHPGLAISWDISEDWKTYTFTLREGVKFHDGVPFNAEALKFTFERILDPSLNSRLAPSYLGPLERAEVIGPYVIRLYYKEPYPVLLNRLARPLLFPVSPEAAKKWGNKDFGRHPVGTGPFIFQEWVPKDHITLVRNPDYKWAPPFYQNQGPSYIDKITVKFITENTTRVTTLETGEVNVAEEIPEQDVQRLRNDKRFTIIDAIKNGTPWLFYVNNAKPPTNDKAVRQAIAYALDREALVSTISFGINQPAYTVLSPPMWSYDPTSKRYEYDPDKAVKLLEAAGWKKGPDGIRVKDGQRLKVLAIQERDPRMEEMIQAMLRDVGMEMEIQMLALPAILAAGDSGDFHLSRVWWVQNDPDMMRNWLLSANIPPNGTKGNPLRVNNPELDELLIRGSVLPYRSQEREEVYKKIQQIVMDNAYVIPIAHVTRLIGFRAEVKNISFDSNGYYPLFHDAWVIKK
jgi:peptide/nickel transport system substrate-binding protein